MTSLRWTATTRDPSSSGHRRRHCSPSGPPSSQTRCCRSRTSDTKRLQVSSVREGSGRFTGAYDIPSTYRGSSEVIDVLSVLLLFTTLPGRRIHLVELDLRAVPRPLAR